MAHVAPDVLFAMNRSDAYNRNRKPEAPNVDGEYMGHTYGAGHSGTSWSCGSLSLYGYATERQLRSAMKRKLPKKA